MGDDNLWEKQREKKGGARRAARIENQLAKTASEFVFCSDKDQEEEQ